MSYNSKHNEANGENNRDGTDDNNSWNGGAEGPSDNPAIIALREKQKRNLIATLVFFSRSADAARRRRAEPHQERDQQHLLPGQRPDLATLEGWTNGSKNSSRSSRRSSASGGRSRCSSARKFFKGRSIRGSHIKDISFLDPSGQEMTDEAWNAGLTKCIGVRLAGDLIDDETERGEPIVGDTLLLLLNAHHEAIPFTLPLTKAEQRQREQLLDTADGTALRRRCFRGRKNIPLKDRTLAILRTRGVDDALPIEAFRHPGGSDRPKATPAAAAPGRPPLD